MIHKPLQMCVLGIPFLTILFTDYIFEFGIIDSTRRILSNHFSFTTKFLGETLNEKIGNDTVMSFEYMLTEFILLSFTAALFNRYNQYRRKDKLDLLVQQGKESLKQTEEIIDKWRQRQESTNTYFDDENHDGQPSKIEVSVLHLAILDALGNTRGQHERGDSGDTFSVTDSAFVFSSSLLDEDLDSNTEEPDGGFDETSAEFKTRYVWDVMED